MGHTVRPGTLMAVGPLFILYIKWLPWSEAVLCGIAWVRHFVNPGNGAAGSTVVRKGKLVSGVCVNSSKDKSVFLQHRKRIM